MHKSLTPIFVLSSYVCAWYIVTLILLICSLQSKKNPFFPKGLKKLFNTKYKVAILMLFGDCILGG